MSVYVKLKPYILQHHHSFQRSTDDLDEPEGNAKCNGLHSRKLLEKPEPRTKVADHIEEANTKVRLIQEFIGFIKGIICNNVDRDRSETMMEVDMSLFTQRRLDS